ncbi:thioredoxin domain-containing protein [Streptomyces sp. NPDC046870]|uniref:thioredoxin domain-containing protein n=1 Tax=Streptomyces sp. NPDC046870 TaxID=3155135 RepID=UPI0034550983
MVRRMLATAVAVSVAGAAAVGCDSGQRTADSGQRSAGSNGGRPDPTVTATAKAVPYTGPADVPERLGNDGTTIMVGDEAAPLTVHLYEDPRCPVCERFETTGGAPQLREATMRREVKTQYTLASFLDARLGGAGSRKAVNALRAALDKGWRAGCRGCADRTSTRPSGP